MMNFDAPTPSSGQESKKSATEKINDPELPKQVAAAFKEKLDAYVDEHSDYISEYVITDQIAELCARIREKLGLPEKEDAESAEELDVSGESSQSPSNSYGEPGDIHGRISFQGEQILTWSSAGDGWSGSIDSWDDAALNRAMQKYVGKLKGEVG